MKEIDVGNKNETLVFPKGRLSLSITKYDAGLKFKRLKKEVTLDLSEVNRIFNMFYRDFCPNLYSYGELRIIRALLKDFPKVQETWDKIINRKLTPKEEEELKKEFELMRSI